MVSIQILLVEECEIGFNFVTACNGTNDTVDDCLVVQDLGGRDGSRAAIDDCIGERLDLAVEQVGLDFGSGRNNGRPQNPAESGS